LSYRNIHGVAPATQNKYKTFTRQLLAYAEYRGYVCLDQLGVTDMDLFTAGWKDNDRSTRMSSPNTAWPAMSSLGIRRVGSGTCTPSGSQIRA